MIARQDELIDQLHNCDQRKISKSRICICNCLLFNYQLCFVYGFITFLIEEIRY